MILDGTGTLENEWAVYAAVGTHDETHSNFYTWIAGTKNRVRSGESLGGMSAFTVGRRAGARHIGEFGDVDRSPPKLLFARGKIRAGNAQVCAMA